MKSRRLILLAGALLLALATAWVARALMRPPPPVTIVKEVPVPQATAHQVLVAQRDLQPGEFLDGSALSWQELPATAVRAQHFQAQSESEQRQRESSVHGATLRRPLVAGAPLTRELLVYAGQPGFLAAVLAPGMRAVSIPTNMVDSNAGLVSAGDRVDVILSLERDTVNASSDNPDSSFALLASQTIVRDVRVLALNNNTASIAPSINDKDPSGEGKPHASKRDTYESITLEVTPAAAEQLALAREVGTLQVALRGVAEQHTENASLVGIQSNVTRINDTTGIFDRQNQRPVTATVQTFLGAQQGQQVFGGAH